MHSEHKLFALFWGCVAIVIFVVTIAVYSYLRQEQECRQVIGDACIKAGRQDCDSVAGRTCDTTSERGR